MLRVIAETTERVDVFRTRRVRTCLSLSVNKIHPSLHEPTLSASFLPYELCYTGAETRERKPERRCHHVLHHRDRHLRMSIQSLAGLHQEHHKALMDMRQTRRGDSVPSSRTSGRTASCSGAGWTGRFGPGKVQQPWPRPPTCRYRRWGRRMTRRHSLTSLRRPRQHVGGPRRTGQCASSPC